MERDQSTSADTPATRPPETTPRPAASLRASLAALERRLAGEDRPRPWPSTWAQPSDGAGARIGVAAADLATGGYRRAQPGAQPDAQPGEPLGERSGRPAGAQPGEPARGAGTGQFEHRADERFPAASTMKVYVLQALLEAVAAGTRGLDETLALRAGDGVSGSGVLKLLTAGTRLSLLDLATLMITVSDNTATNLLIETLGLDAVRASVSAHGWSDTYLRGKLQQAPATPAASTTPTLTSPRDLADYFSRLWAGELLPAELTRIAQGIYRRQQLGELGRGLDYDSYSAEVGESELLIASKSGSIRGVRNDAGAVELTDLAGRAGGGRDDRHAGSAGAGTRTVVLAIMTDGCPDRRFHAENLGAVVVGQVAAAVLAHLTG